MGLIIKYLGVRVLLDLLMNRRTVRSYRDKKVEKEKIDRIVEGALTAPSGRNLRPVEILVVEDKDKLNSLGKARGLASQWIASGPLGFVIVADSSKSTTWLSDAAITASFIQLMGQDLGLSSCWIHVENRKADDGSDVENNVRKILNIPDKYRVSCMISMGYGDGEFEKRKVDELDFSRVHYENFKLEE